MQNDPRRLNQTFSQDSIQAYLSEYSISLQKCLVSIPPEAINAARQLMLDVRASGHRIFVAGNGGSAAIADHLGCDWQKGIHIAGRPGLHVHSLTSNTALLTAVANDFGYSQSFAFQLEMAELRPGDAVILISSSGNSENIVKAAEFAKSRKSKVIGLTGFSGGQLKALADVSLHIPFSNYGLVEDAHQALMHVLAQFHDLEFQKGSL
jgi:phosphoheptose isomerase